MSNRSLAVVAVPLVTAAWAALCNGVVEFLQAGGDAREVLVHDLGGTPLLFLLSSALVWAVLIGCVAVSGRLFLPCGLLLAASTLVGVADAEKLRLRREPLYPSDVAFAGKRDFLVAMVGGRAVATIVLVVVLELALVLLVGRLLRRRFPRARRRHEPRRWRRLLAARVATATAAALLIVHVHHFNTPGNGVRGLYERAGATWASWSQKANYERNGFVAGWLYNLDVPAMKAPADYSTETMAAISRRYAAVADRLNRTRDAAALSDLNVVLILSEAFSDPTQIAGPQLDDDPIPFTRHLMETTASGTMLAQHFGGGTANMEFEALTGQSLSQFQPQLTTPYQMLVPAHDTFPSAVGYFGAHGHVPLAVHPYLTTMYKRNEVYPVLGFDRFVHGSTMRAPRRIDDNPFISDDSAFKEVERQIAGHDQPVFVNLVTMQNHYPMADKYEDPIGVTGLTGETAAQLSGYARGLRHSDDALRALLQRLRSSREKTVLLLYGDHAPAFWDGEVYERNGDAAFLRTPWFMWSNSTPVPHDHEPPVTSPIYFVPMLLDRLHAPLPPYYALLHQMRTELPAMEQGEYFLPDGSTATEAELDPRARRLLHDYRLVQYDLAVGHRYAQSEMFYRSE